MKEYDLYVPLTYNDGTPIEAKTIERIGQRMLERFGGVTFFPQPNEGLWRMGEVTFRDQIVIFRVLSAKCTRRTPLLQDFETGVENGIGATKRSWWSRKTSKRYEGLVAGRTAEAAMDAIDFRPQNPRDLRRLVGWVQPTSTPS